MLVIGELVLDVLDEILRPALVGEAEQRSDGGRVTLTLHPRLVPCPAIESFVMIADGDGVMPDAVLAVFGGTVVAIVLPNQRRRRGERLCVYREACLLREQ